MPFQVVSRVLEVIQGYKSQYENVAHIIERPIST
jgi:hypothetical protein